MPKKKEEYPIVCFYCGGDFKCKAADRFHLTACCKEEKCRRKLMASVDREKYLSYLNGFQEKFKPVGRKNHKKFFKGIQQTLKFTSGKLYRLTDDVCLGEPVSIEGENLLVNKNGNSSPAKYCLITIKELTELKEYVANLTKQI